MDRGSSLDFLDGVWTCACGPNGSRESMLSWDLVQTSSRSEVLARCGLVAFVPKVWHGIFQLGRR